MNRFFSLLVVFLAVPSVVWAQSGTLVEMPAQIILNEPESKLSMPNVEQRQDLHQHATKSKGKLKGDELGLDQRRPPVNLQAELETSEGLRVYTSNLFTDEPLAKGEVIVANIEHLGKFYVGIVPINKVNSLDMVYSTFMPMIAAHFLSIFNFNEGQGIRLIAEILTPEDKAARGPQILRLDHEIELNELVLSIEATASIFDPDYNLVKGAQEYFMVTYLLTTVASRLKDYVATGYPQTVHRASFSPEQVSKILQEALHTGDRAGLEILYHTLFSNCTNLAMEIYERAIPFLSREEASQLRKFLHLTLDRLLPISKTYPILNELYGTTVRGFGDKNVPVKNLEHMPKWQNLIEKFKRENPNSPLHAVAEVSVSDRAFNKALCNTLLFRTAN